MPSVELIHDTTQLHDIVVKLSEFHEQRNASSNDPAKTAVWVLDYNENLLNAIVGIRVSALKIMGKAKISQNKTQQNQLNIANALVQQIKDNEKLEKW